MDSNAGQNQIRILVEETEQRREQTEGRGDNGLRLRRWLVSFASGPGWYPVGEFVAQDAQAAIDWAIEVFGAASGYRAEQIPWDAAPLARPNLAARWERR
jgi:hypothetical protein